RRTMGHTPPALRRRLAMESRAKLLGHSVHQMLIVFPLGLLATAVIFDIISLITGRPAWTDASYHMIPAGIIGGLIAAVFGLLDWLKIPSGTRAWRVGAWHGGGNVIVVLLFAISWWMRRAAPSTPSGRALVFSFIGVLLALVTRSEEHTSELQSLAYLVCRLLL